MSIGQRIIKNSVILISSQIFSKIINFALILILTRLLGKDAFGLYSFSSAYVGLFLFLMHMGINNLLVREVAKYKDKSKEIINTTLPTVIFLTLFSLVLLNFIAFLLNWTANERIVIFLFSLYYMFDIIARFFIAIMRAYERMEYEGLLIVFERTMLLIVSILLWMSNADLVTLLICFIFVLFLKAAYSLFLIKKYFLTFNIHWNFEQTKDILKQSYPFALMGMFGTISMRIDLVILKIYHTQDLVGIYNVAKKLIESINFLPENIYYAVFPTLSILYLNQKDKFNQTFKYVLIVLIISAIPIVIIFNLLAPKIINFLFEPEFYQAYLPLQWLAIATAAFFIKHAFAVTLHSVGKQHIFSLFVAIGMVINISCNLILIPPLKMLGAALASVMAESVIAVLSFFAVKKYVSYMNFIPYLLKIMIATLIMIIILYLAYDWNIIILISISILAYTSLLIAFKIIPSNIFQMIINKTFTFSNSAHD
jgi:O-antigen/teichoic acid export membrane protein